MKNFLKIAEGIDVMPLLLAIRSKPELWNQNSLRTATPGTPHGEVSDIWLRFNRLPQPGEEAQVVDDCECINYPGLAELPQARPLLFWLMSRVEGERIGRAVITSLPPGGRIAPHVDGGAPATYYERFHIVLQSNWEAGFRAGDELVSMQAGEVWWFDNCQEHEVFNNGKCDRIHVVVDIRTSRSGA